MCCTNPLTYTKVMCAGCENEICMWCHIYGASEGVFSTLLSTRFSLFFYCSIKCHDKTVMYKQSFAVNHFLEECLRRDDAALPYKHMQEKLEWRSIRKIVKELLTRCMKDNDVCKLVCEF